MKGINTDKNVGNNAKTKSDLSVNGFIFTATALHQWCKTEVDRLKRHLDLSQDNIKARLYSYRRGGDNHLALDLYQADTLATCVTFCAFGYNAYQYEAKAANSKYNDIEIIDMAEAMHAVGIILQALDIKVVVVGKTDNEMNEALFAYPVRWRESNGCLDLWQAENKSVLH